MTTVEILPKVTFTSSKPTPSKSTTDDEKQETKNLKNDEQQKLNPNANTPNQLNSSSQSSKSTTPINSNSTPTISSTSTSFSSRSNVASNKNYRTMKINKINPNRYQIPNHPHSPITRRGHQSRPEKVQHHKQTINQQKNNKNNNPNKKLLPFDNERVLQNLIRTQIEYLFSDFHLTNDTYLLARMQDNSDHWLSIDEICHNQKIRCLTNKKERILQALKESIYLELSSDNNNVRRPDFKLPKLKPNRDLRRTVFLYGIDKKKASGDIKKLLSSYGHIKRIHFQSQSDDNNNHNNNNDESGGNDDEAPNKKVAALIMKKKFLFPSRYNIGNGDEMQLEHNDIHDINLNDDGSQSISYSHPIRNPSGDITDFNHLTTCFVVFESQSQATKCVKARVRAKDGMRCIHKYDYNKVAKKFRTAQMKGENLSFSPPPTVNMNNLNILNNNNMRQHHGSGSSTHSNHSNHSQSAKTMRSYNSYRNQRYNRNNNGLSQQNNNNHNNNIYSQNSRNQYEVRSNSHSGLHSSNSYYSQRRGGGIVTGQASNYYSNKNNNPSYYQTHAKTPNFKPSSNRTHHQYPNNNNNNNNNYNGSGQRGERRLAAGSNHHNPPLNTNHMHQPPARNNNNNNNNNKRIIYHSMKKGIGSSSSNNNTIISSINGDLSKNESLRKMNQHQHVQKPKTRSFTQPNISTNGNTIHLKHNNENGQSIKKIDQVEKNKHKINPPQLHHPIHVPTRQELTGYNELYYLPFEDPHIAAIPIDDAAGLGLYEAIGVDDSGLFDMYIGAQAQAQTQANLNIKPRRNSHNAPSMTSTRSAYYQQHAAATAAANTTNHASQAYGHMAQLSQNVHQQKYVPRGARNEGRNESNSAPYGPVNTPMPNFQAQWQLDKIAKQQDNNNNNKILNAKINNQVKNINNKKPVTALSVLSSPSTK